MRKKIKLYTIKSSLWCREIHSPSSPDSSPARRVCIKQCSPTRLQKWTFPSCSPLMAPSTKPWPAEFPGLSHLLASGRPLFKLPRESIPTSASWEQSRVLQPELSDRDQSSVTNRWALMADNGLERTHFAVSGSLRPASPEGYLLDVREIHCGFLFAFAKPSVWYLLSSCEL